MSDIIDPAKVDYKAVDRKVAEICGFHIGMFGTVAPEPPGPYLVYFDDRDRCMEICRDNAQREAWRPHCNLNQVRDYLWPAMLERGYCCVAAWPGIERGHTKDMHVYWTGVSLPNERVEKCRATALTADTAFAICLTACIAVYGEDWDKSKGPRPEGFTLGAMRTISITGKCHMTKAEAEYGCRHGWFETKGVVPMYHYTLTYKGWKALEENK